METTYRLLKFIENRDSICIWETFETDNFFRVGNGYTIPTYRLIQEWYIEVVIPEWISTVHIEWLSRCGGSFKDFAEIVLRSMPKN